jgi:hypothetical protein
VVGRCINSVISRRDELEAVNAGESVVFFITFVLTGFAEVALIDQHIVKIERDISVLEQELVELKGKLKPLEDKPSSKEALSVCAVQTVKWRRQHGHQEYAANDRLPTSIALPCMLGCALQCTDRTLPNKLRLLVSPKQQTTLM